MNSEGCRFTRLRAQALYEKAGWNVPPAELGRAMRRAAREAARDPLEELKRFFGTALAREEPTR